ncbi:MAG: hypothetical protein AAF550_01600 [Myxococcota bacterium]
MLDKPQPQSKKPSRFLSALRSTAHRLIDRAAKNLDADRALMGSMAALIELAKRRYPIDPGAQWRPGTALRLLLAGYSGTRNTGADVRVEEMIRQFRHLFGDDHLELSLLTIDPELTKGYFRTVRQLKLPQVYPRFLFDVVHEHHGVIACEGSMFKSKFANALSTMMVGALGLASAEYKLAVGYGGEAGSMDEALEALVTRYCQDALILSRNHESQSLLRELGIPSTAGTDTAWTFSPGTNRGQILLQSAGWDERTPILALCPINPFWWPVKPDLLKGVEHVLTNAHADAHYSSVYFHHEGEKVRKAQNAYLDAWAEGVGRFKEKYPVYPVVIGMEKLDRAACEGLAHRLGGSTPIFVSDQHDMYAMVDLVRQARWMISSRYHAIVTSMPAGVASVGVTMDERIRNLMEDRGTPELAIDAGDEHLADAIYERLCQVRSDEATVQRGIEECVVSNLNRMGYMGIELVDYVQRSLPDFPFRQGLGNGAPALAHLPPLPQNLRELLERRG